MAEDKKGGKRPQIDWEAIERDYRAGIKTLRQMADEHGITHGAINKKAKAEGWSRDLQAKIVAKAEEQVSKAVVSNEVSKASKVSEREVIEANAGVLAQADLTNRSDLLLALRVSRGQLEELEALSNPAFAERLEWLGELMDESGKDENGRAIRDQANELYRYIIGLAGRVKMAKDVAGSMGVYIPLQRKVLKLDVDADQNQNRVDDALRKILASS